MDVRAQVSMVFHLDKCIGCHTCSISCKNIWTDRRGVEYMWWNNVETKPGTGYPTLWEDQEKYRGGWVNEEGEVRLKLQNRTGVLGNIFANPHMPTLDDYYEPWTYRYEDLFSAPESDDQPTARPVSMISGKPIEIEAGPNWDDDLSGSPVYANNDLNLESLSEEEKQQLFELERMIFFYVPRICNHCLNAGCVAACPSGAVYKRGEDGVVLINQDKCRGWRMCVSGCPYKKAYYNWSTGKSEKCILCYPRLETGQAPACFHSCVGRIRYLGVLLYDADRIQETIKRPDHSLVEAQRNLILDPNDPQVIKQARANSLDDAVISAAQRSPVYKFVKEYKLALPLHPEFRTLPMLFYVPPLLPVLGNQQNGSYELATDYFSSLESARVPLRYLASLFAAGDESAVADVYKKLIAIRKFKRSQVVQIGEQDIEACLSEAGLSPEQAEEIYRLTALSTFDERLVVPPMAREVAIEATEDTSEHKAHTGFGFNVRPKRGA